MPQDIPEEDTLGVTQVILEEITTTEVEVERRVRPGRKSIKSGMTGNLRGQTEVADPKKK